MTRRARTVVDLFTGQVSAVLDAALAGAGMTEPIQSKGPARTAA
jgi:hypothetical protein